MDYGILSLLPVAVVIVLVFFTRRTALSLLAGTLLGAVMLHGAGFFSPWLDVVYGVMGSDLWIWLVLVCGFFGSLVEIWSKDKWETMNSDADMDEITGAMEGLGLTI